MISHCGKPVPQLHRAFIALGSNLGPRKTLLKRAITLLRKRNDIAVRKVSSFYETAPVGGPEKQRNYINAAAELATPLTPAKLLTVLLAVERKLGRTRRRNERNAPRTIDLDLLVYDDLVRKSRRLTLPHPRMHERVFVLDPLSEIAPNARHPVIKKTFRVLRKDLQRK